jgi:DNA-binding HxlR family transcriptional regulator
VRIESADPESEATVWFGAPRLEPDPEELGLPEGESLFKLIASRWVVAVLRELRGEAVRYNALHRRLQGVSHKVLTQTLRRLQRAGIVTRRAYPTTPPTVDYVLTTRGFELLENLERLERWAGGRGLLGTAHSHTGS